MKERGLGFDTRLSEPRKPYLHRSPFTVHDDDDLIYAYTRQQALADGVLVDVSQMAKEISFRFPTAITADLHAKLDPKQAEKAAGQNYDGRLWDVLWMASLAARQSKRDRIDFQVFLTEINNELNQHVTCSILSLWMVVGPGDQGEPVITIGFPEDF